MSKQTVLVIGNQGFLFEYQKDLDAVTNILRCIPQVEQVFNVELGVYEWHLLDKPKDFRIEFTDVIDTKE